MQNIIYLKKYSKNDSFWENLFRKKKVLNLNVEQVVGKYQGFEGDYIKYLSFENFVANREKQKNVVIDEDYDEIILVNSDKNFDEETSIRDFHFMGYDIGMCDEEWTPYSSIFHECLFGNLSELIDFQTILNEHFLFPNRNLAEKYVDIHNQLSKLGKDVEDYMAMNLYQIWKYNEI